jgi:hypothetical protein
MNTPEPYERRRDRTIPQAAPARENAGSTEPLAVHGDPSVPTGQAMQEPDLGRPSLAWVRPSEMTTMLGARSLRRGIDVEAELARRARRLPGAAVAKASRRITRSSIARPATTYPTVSGKEGLGL